LPHSHKHGAVRVANEFDEEAQGLIAIQQGSLQNKITDIETRLVADVINRLTKSKNAFEKTNDILEKKQQEMYEAELEKDLNAFYLVLMPVFASMILAKRAKEFNMLASFKVDPAIRRDSKELAKKVAQGHIATITEDLRKTIKETYDNVILAELSAIEDSGRKVTDADLKLARKKALEGNGQARIVSDIKQEYSKMTEGRAKTIARTESSRAFNQSQLQADLQFAKQNDLEGRVYKKWVTRSGNPCEFCVDMANQPPIPLDKNFVDFGDTLEVESNNDGKVKIRKMSIDFEAVNAGLLHPNCGCTYRLIVE